VAGEHTGYVNFLLLANARTRVARARARIMETAVAVRIAVGSVVGLMVDTEGLQEKPTTTTWQRASVLYLPVLVGAEML
jgi:hypothetical protein